MIRRPPRSTQSRSSAASDVYKRQSLLWTFQDAHSDIRTCTSMRVDGSPFRIHQLQLGILQVLLDGPLQLPKGKYSLHYSACPHRMTAGQQTTGWVHRYGRLLWKVHAVINAGNTGLATCRVGPAFTVFAETHVLVGLDL